MNDKAKAFYKKVETYGGWRRVQVERVHSIFVETVRPAEIGFVLAKRGFWGRQVDASIFQVIKMDSLKGGYGLSYGLSLSYVPYPYAPRLRWHRTLKAVSLDLWETPQVYLADSPADGKAYVASALLGEQCLREELEAVWRRCSPRILAWFDATRSFDEILAKCREHFVMEQRARSQRNVQYVPGARLIYAFTCAKVGRLDEAKRELEKFCEEWQEGAEARANLGKALEQVASA